MAAFKKERLTRFVGTDEGEGIEYLGCELIRDRSAKTAKIFQKGYEECVSKTLGMWDCKLCATPLDANLLIAVYLRRIAHRLWTQPFITATTALLDACHIW
jgi:hypothetical protein